MEITTTTTAIQTPHDVIYKRQQLHRRTNCQPSQLNVIRKKKSQHFSNEFISVVVVVVTNAVATIAIFLYFFVLNSFNVYVFTTSNLSRIHNQQIIHEKNTILFLVRLLLFFLYPIVFFLNIHQLIFFFLVNISLKE